MKKKNKNKRETIFKLFSQNLEWIKEHPSISFKPDFINGYICPLCFDVFFEKDLDITLSNHLTLEDIPPEKLGGKPRALTCKSCNSKSGHKLDVHLLNSLMKIDFHSFLPNARTNTAFELNGNKVNGIVVIDEKGTMKLDLQTKRSNPKQSKQFMNDLILPQTIYNPMFYPEKAFEPRQLTTKFTLKPLSISDERRSEVALLRIAYLIAFCTFGNGFLINGNLYKIREQILNPDKNILPKVFWIKFDFPEEFLGINIIKSPKELRCFLIIFNLSTKSKSRQFAIALPGQSDPGLKIYDYIENILCQGDGTDFINIDIEHLKDRNWLTEKKLTFASNSYWQELTKEESKIKN